MSEEKLVPVRWTLTLDRVKSFNPCKERFAALKRVLKKLNKGKAWPYDKPFFAADVAPLMQWHDLYFVLDQIEWSADSTPIQRERAVRAREAVCAADNAAFQEWIRTKDTRPLYSEVIHPACREALMPYLRGEVV